MKFRKKPIVIEAEQWFPGSQMPGIDERVTCTACRALFPEDASTFACCGPTKKVGIVETLEGHMAAQPGDWIITGIKGERYPCKPDIFAAAYEAVNEPTPTKEDDGE